MHATGVLRLGAIRCSFAARTAARRQSLLKPSMLTYQTPEMLAVRGFQLFPAPHLVRHHHHHHSEP
jgi:hypothetical protein